MTPEVQTLITACEWSTSSFLIISDNVFSPLLYYSYFGSVIPCIVIALFVFFKGPKKLANRLLLLTILSFTAWVFGALVTWATEYPAYTMFFWSSLNIFEPLVYFFAFYFVYVLVFEKDFSTIQKIIFSLPLLVTFALTPTGFGLLGYNLADCERNAVEGIVATYGYTIEIVYVFLIFGLTLFFIKKTKDAIEKKKAILLTIGIIAFLLSFSLGNILEVFTENWYIGQYGLFGAPVFIGFLVYSIVKYKTFNIKLVGSFALIFSLATLNFSMLFITQVETLRIVTTITFLLTIIFGIALIKSILREIRQNEAIEQLIKARSEFLTVASHQLRTPVSLITGTLSLMQDGTIDQLPPDQKTKLLDGIFVKSRKLTNIINDILQASEMDIMNFHLSKEAIQPLDVQKLLTKVCTDLQEKADAGKITLTYEQVASDKAVMVSGNEHYLEEALANIVDNAIKYTPKGFVKMELISPEIGTNKVIVKVSDSGIGVPLDDQPKIFEKFTRAKNAVNSYADGSGLGLFIVKKIIEAHPGGKIYFVSAGEGKGTTFYVELTKS